MMFGLCSLGNLREQGHLEAAFWMSELIPSFSGADHVAGSEMLCTVDLDLAKRWQNMAGHRDVDWLCSFGQQDAFS